MWNKRSDVFKKIWIHLLKREKNKTKLFTAAAGMIIKGLL